MIILRSYAQPDTETHLATMLRRRKIILQKRKMLKAEKKNAENSSDISEILFVMKALTF